MTALCGIKVATLKINSDFQYPIIRGGSLKMGKARTLIILGQKTRLMLLMQICELSHKLRMTSDKPITAKALCCKERTYCQLQVLSFNNTTAILGLYL